MYMMSFFTIPQGVMKKPDYFRLDFCGNKKRRKYQLAKWSILYQPKDKGGLGI
jgi:hypothetical protein